MKARKRSSPLLDRLAPEGSPPKLPSIANSPNVHQPFRVPRSTSSPYFLRDMRNSLDATVREDERKRVKDESAASTSTAVVGASVKLGTGAKRPSTSAATPLSGIQRKGQRPLPRNSSSFAGSTSPLRAIQPTNTRPATPRSSKVVLTEENASATAPSEFDLCGLPPEVQSIYKEKRKISSLYDWQKECLSGKRLLNGENMIVCLPTGAGKTLVAEVLMLREALVNGRSSILVLPYVAIVQEKMTSLSVFEEAFGIHVEEYAASKGRLPPIKRKRAGKSIYVATIEKANMLVNSLLETDRLEEIGLVVVDELHMIGEGRRGACIESMLTKFFYRGVGQVVGMSATLSNMDELKTFMKAAVFTTDFRPVALDEMVRIGPRLLRVSRPSGILNFAKDLPPNKLASKDPDGVVQLLQDVIPKHSVIIFCPTKKNCENVAQMIARLMPKKIRDMFREEREAIVNLIREDDEGKMETALELCLAAGIAWHHSGLTHDERKHIDRGVLCVLCATSTLAAGVNLPARRVIIKAPMVGRERLRKAQYLQMIGRAGRAGFDDRGDAITILRPGPEENAFREMLLNEEMRCVSAMGDADEMAALVLDAIALKLVSDYGDLVEFASRLLLTIQRGREEVTALLRGTLDTLKGEGLVSEEENGDLSITPTGTAAFGASLPPSRTAPLQRDLLATLSTGVVFSSHLHLLFIVAPYDLSCNINWDLYYNEFVSLPECERRLLESAGVPMARIMQHITRKKPVEAGDPSMRLYIALMMQHVWRQEPHASVAEAFFVERGWLQQALQSCVSHAAAIAKFSERLPETLWPLRLLLPELVSRLSECKRPELLPLMTIDLVKKRRAAQLYAAGYKTIAAVARASPTTLLRDIENLGRYQASKMIQSAKSLLRDQMDEKLEELEAIGVTTSDLMTGLAVM